MGQGQGFSITSESIEVSGVSYPLSEVETVTLQHPLISPGFGVVIVLIGVVSGVLGYLVWGTALALAGATIALAGVLITLLAQSVYQVRLNRTTSTPILLSFNNLGEAQQVLAACGAALDQQRAFADDHLSEREVGGT